ncbi:MAG: hypothetical protein ABIR24_05390 [Verrucomicrobiota bacterium]
MNKTTNIPQFTGFITNFIKKNKVVVATAPVLSSAIRFPHGPFQFQVQVTNGCGYDIQFSPDLRNWSSLSSGTARSESFDYVDSDASKFSFRFYRALCGQFASANIIGYATVTLPPGFSMIANPFSAPSNTIAALFPNMAEGTTLCKFDTSLFRLTNNSIKNGKWTNTNEKLVPGEGAIFFNPTTEFKTLNFVGEVSQGRLLNPIPAGLSIRSSLVPQPGRLNSDLGFPIAEGDVIHIFDRDQQKYVVHPFSTQEWEKNPPTVGVGESFWIGKTNPGNWVRDFSVAA